MSKLDAKIPGGPLADKWKNHKAALKLVNPANKKKLDIIVVGTGLAGAGAASTLGELGYNVKVFCYQDSPRRAHSVAAQGGINAAKNYRNDNDSVYRLFYDMIKGGDFRARGPTFTVQQRYPTLLLTTTLPLAFLLPAITVECLITAHLEGYRYRVPSTQRDKLASSVFWVPTAPLTDKLMREPLPCTLAAMCWT